MKKENLIYIAHDVFMSADIKSNSKILLNGTLDGSVSKAESINVEMTGCCFGNIVAKNTIISGKVYGDIKADKVHLTETAYVEGNVYTKEFSIDRGGQFKGNKFNKIDE